ncbi:tigger transposable element-derived 4 [Brachionus plicatilis]|uniref:Tigger transposable element-derived 4 n=1 Tax=Brachionus plicatilis TaxID=10195 RepID=A0A3M7PRF0_BRAPC|nr:tigger transposable element-derived 4 [Brachionus plicatilis]
MESKKRKSPEISLKLEIIEDYNNKANPTELSGKYGLAASTISTIVKNQEATKKASESMRDIKKAKRLREPEYQELEKYLDMWFRDTKAHNSITVDGPLIQAQALKIATMLQKPDFKASSGNIGNLAQEASAMSRIGLEKSDWGIKVYQQTQKYYSDAQFAEQFTNSKRSERTHETERTQVVVVSKKKTLGNSYPNGRDIGIHVDHSNGFVRNTERKKKVVEDVVVPKACDTIQHYSDQHVVVHKSCSTPTTKLARERYNDQNRIEGQPKKVLIEEMNPTAPRADNTFVDPGRQVRFKMPNTLSQHNPGQKIETINPYPIFFVSPPDKFDPKRTDVRQWIKDFDMFIESYNINSHKLNIVIAHLDHETKKIIENSQFSLNEETAYAELKTLLSQLYGRKTTSNLELKRQFTERVQSFHENVYLYASQLKVMSKQSHYELLPYQRDNLVKEQFIRGLRDKFLRTRLQIIREDTH